MIRSRLLVVLLATALVPAVLTAQSPPKDSQDQDVPELAGAERVEGIPLVDGKLPKPFVDYCLTVRDSTEKLSLFQSGLVVVSTTSGKTTVRKSVLIPPGAVDEYRKFLTPARLAATQQPDRHLAPTSSTETIRITDEDGQSAIRVIDPATAISSDLGRIRFLVQDLVRVVEEDKEITNPMIDYVPKAGDVLVGNDMSTWTIVSVHATQGFIEVASTSSPVSMYVQIKELEEKFLGHRTPRTAE